MNPETLLTRRGVMLILSSPSGAGKSTLTRLVVQKLPDIRLSVSVTTRPRRPSEVNDVHYSFIDTETFLSLRDRGELIEWAEVHGNFYGTPRKPVEAVLTAGQDMLFDIDWQGTRQIVEKMPTDTVTVFILPPSMEELRSRLVRRAEDAPETIARRLANSAQEIPQWNEYDYILVNNDLEQTYNKLVAILTASRLKRERVTGLEGFVKTLVP